MTSSRLRPWWERALCALLAVLMALPASVVVSLAQSGGARILVNEGDPSRSVVTNLTVTLTNDLVPVPGGVSIRRLPFGPALDSSNLFLTTLGQSNAYRVTFTNLPGNRLPEGNFLASVVAAEATNLAGPRVSDSFALFSFFGDWDGDRDIDFHDTFGFRATWLLSAGDSRFDDRFDDRFDEDGDGLVNGNDLAHFNTNYFTVLAPSPGLFAHLETDEGADLSHGLTRAAGIIGQAVVTNAAARVEAALRVQTDLRPFHYQDITSDLRSGTFHLDSNRLAQLVGLPLAPAAYDFSARIVETNELTSARFDLSFRIAGDGCQQFATLEGWEWRSTTNGLAGAHDGRVTAESCEAVLSEGGSFEVELSRQLLIPEGAATLVFEFHPPEFDTSALGRMRDAFEAALVDSAGRPLTFTIQGSAGVTSPATTGAPALPPTPTAFLNITEGLPPASAPGTLLETLADGVIRAVVDVRPIGVDSTARLLFRLVNNDGDQSGRVRIVSHRFSADVPAELANGQNVPAFSSSWPGMRTAGALAKPGGSSPGREVASRSSKTQQVADSRETHFVATVLTNLLDPGNGTGLLAFSPDTKSSSIAGDDHSQIHEVSPTTEPAVLFLEVAQVPAEGATGSHAALSGVVGYSGGSTGQGEIIAVTLNGNSVEALDAAGNFFTTYTVRSGRNTLRVEAEDSLGHRVFSDIVITGTSGDVSETSRLEVVTSSIEQVFGRTGLRDKEPVLYSEVSLRNLSTYALGGKLLVGITGLSHPSIKVLGADGVTADGIPYYDYSSAVAGGRLEAGQTTALRTLAFGNPGQIPFTFQVVVLGQANRAPAFTSVPVLSAAVGREYHYPAAAADPDGDVLSFSGTVTPPGLNVDPATGFLSWTPGDEDVGNHEVRLVAQDNHGGSAIQKYVLAVSQPPSNRPPHFVSSPITIAHTAKATVGKPTSGGRIFLANDEYQLSDFGFEQEPRTDSFVGSLTSWFLEGTGKPVGRFFAPTANFSLTGGALSRAMSALGHQWGTGFLDFGLTNLTNYDGLFLAGLPPRGPVPESTDLNLLGDYLKAGGNIYIAAGTLSFGDATTEAIAWNAFLKQFGLAYESKSFNGIAGVISFRSDHPVFGGVFGLFQNNGNSIHDLDPNDDAGKVLVEKDGEGLYAVYDPRNAAGVQYSYLPLAEDPDGDSLSFTLLEAPIGMWINAISGLVRWAPTIDQLGQHTVVVQVADGHGGVARQVYVICVLQDPANRPPIFISMAPPKCMPIAANTTDPGAFGYEYQASAVDPDGDPVSYRIAGAPVGVECDAATGVISSGTNQVPAGSYPIKITVSDGRGGAAMQEFPLVIGERCKALIQGLVWKDLNTNGVRDAGASALEPGLAGAVAFLDIDGDRLRSQGEPAAVSDSGGAFAFTDIAPGQYHLRIEPARGLRITTPSGDGTYLVTVEANETTNLYAFGVIDVPNPSEANRPPNFSTQPPNSLRVGGVFLYRPLVRDPDGDTCVFDLVLPPAGAIVITNSGTVGWQPSAEQIGNHDFVLRANDGHGGITLQSFRVSVLEANTPPLLTSTFPGSAVVGRPVAVQIQAQDAEVQTLTFAVTNPPAGFLLNPTNGIVQWTPTLSQVGPHLIELAVADSEGGSASKTFPVEVRPTAPNSAPRIVTTPRVQSRFDSAWIYLARAVDMDADPLTFSLLEAPSGMLLTNQVFGFNGLVSSAPLNGAFLVWTPEPHQAGANEVRLAVVDGQGGQAEQRFQVVVGSSFQNAAPAIVSAPPLAATVGEIYEYNLVGTDPDGDLLEWRLVSGPSGVSLGAATGALRWVPTMDQLGTNFLVVEVNDGLLGIDQQAFSVEVNCVNRPPSIVSTPVVAASKESAYLYGARATDPDEDRITWSLVDPPPGMTVEGTNGLVRWVVPADALDSYVVQLRASDGRGASDTQTYTLYVSDEKANKPPVITSSPTRGITGGRQYRYDLVASDADGDALTLEFLQAPVGATIVPVSASPGRASASVLWTPDLSLTGSYEFVVAAKDVVGGSCGQRFLVTVRDNEAPRIASAPRATAMPNVLYRYDVVAIDPNGDQLTYRLTQAPTGMTVDALGRIQWRPAAGDLGGHFVSVEVSDGFGGLAQQEFQVAVTADQDPPVVSLTLVSGLVNLDSGGWAGDVGSTVRIQLLATDNVGVVATTLRVGGEVYPLNASGVASIPVTTGGFPEVVGEARDAAGNVGTATRPIQFRDPNATNSIFVGFLSPTNGSVITKRTPIIATITNSTPIRGYSVHFAPVADIDLNNIAAGGDLWKPLGTVELDTPVTSLEAVTVAVFDPLSLINDTYVVRLYVQPEVGDGWFEPLIVSVEGDLKFGEFRIAVTDLQIPLAGIPITVSRVYDSRMSRRIGDFGYGWSLGLQDSMVRVSSRDHQTIELGTRVYLTGPDGRRLGFSTDYQILGSLIILTALEYTFRPDAGIFERLEADGMTDLVNRYGVSPFGAPELNQFRLITRDGTRYEYSRTGGLQGITDTSGNTLRYTPDGIFHYPAGSTNSDQRIQFVRDARGRIERILPPEGPPLVYTYDGAGDLRAFADQATNFTRYAYDSARAHFLTNIVDPFGKNALGLVYDETGVLKEVRDAAGKPIKQDFDADQNLGTFTDARGNQTKVYFDDRGNETARIIPGISTNYLAYDQNNNLISATNANGYATNFVYDAKGNVTRITDALTNVTEISYNSLGKPTSVTNALKQVLFLRYDTAGNLTEVINNLGFTTRVGRDAQGRVTNLVDAVGNTNSFVYEGGCSCGRPGIVFNPDGSFRRYEYDAFGRTNLVVNELGATTRFNYAPDGRLLWIEDALTNRTAYLYDGSRLTNILDALGRPTQFRYDDFGRTNQIITAEGGTNEFRYDENGNRTHVIDAVGNVTRFVYDAANRVTNRIDTFGRTNHFVLDAMGNQIETIDRNGRRRTFAYDALGRMTNEVWWEGSNVVKDITFGFNELGVQTLAADDVARYDYRFDALNRLERVIQALAGGQAEFSLFYTYTANGQVESVTDNWGVTVGSKYDNRNRLEQRIWQGPGVDPARLDFAYDPSGSRVRTDRYADLAGAKRIGFTTNAYNVAGVVTNITHLGPAGEELARYDYDFDAAWQIRHWTINSEVSHFDYDQTGQLTNAVNTATELPDELFRYDANGNRVGAQSGGIYVTNRNNQIFSDGTDTYAYDFEGNMASRSNTVTGVLTTYQWDHRNRLVNVLDSNPDGVVTQTMAFKYDVMNRRRAKTMSGQTTRFLYNGDDSWADLDGSNAITARYLHGVRIDELIARWRASDGRGWYLTDHLGSVRDIANAAGKVTAHVDYSNFGKVIGVSDPGAVDRFLFTGRELDEKTGLYFYRTRYYTPALGRFLSEDSLGFDAGDPNLFKYVINNPLQGIDPSGQIIVEFLILRALNAGRTAPAAAATGLTINRAIGILACMLELDDSRNFKPIAKYALCVLLAVRTL